MSFELLSTEKDTWYVIDLGMSETKIGISSDNMPFKIVRTPADIFLSPSIFVKDYTKIYQEDSQDFRLKLEEFLYSLFYDELIENAESAEVLILLNFFVPKMFIEAIEDILKRRLGVQTVGFIPSQFMPMYLSGFDSGIVMDFGFSQISFVPFYKGFVLKNYIYTTDKSGAALMKRMFSSVKKINDEFDFSDFDATVETMQSLMTNYLMIPTKAECRVMDDGDQDREAMRNKKMKFTGPKHTVYYNYLENYRVGNFLFEGQSIVEDFMNFLLELPMHLRCLLVGNVLPSGSLCLANRFFKRFKEEFETLCNSETYKGLLGAAFKENFHFTYLSYPSPCLSWAGG